MHDVLVVIPVLDEAEHLPDLLSQILEDAKDATIVVADGGSTDGSRAIVSALARKHANLRLMDNPARAQGAGVNLAVRRFGNGHTWLVRVDAHADYPAEYVSALVSKAKELSVESVVVSMHTRGFSCFQCGVAAAQNSVLGTGGSAHRHGGAGRFVDHGHHALMRIDAFRNVGGYCEHFTHNEDAELDHRLRLNGGKIWLEPSLSIVYYPRRDPIALFRQYRKYGQGRARNQQRHQMPIKLRQLLPLSVLPALLLILLIPLSLLFALPFLGWAALSIGFGLYLGLRARSRCASVAGLAAMIMHSAWAIGYIHQRLFGFSPGQAPTAWTALDSV
ncbi:glycosyltransferase family 2 protein [Novosphingobium terrae]|uniref:glycosyltransferase family 2 protein n=1 Tax=Novosphingobium terrae TaxID=2726189 RepID=UPI001F13BF98|nr:glycosyltransferase family 2 protein [Novosphingobium terrae]